MQFAPILEHFIKLSVTVSESLHFFIISDKLSLVFLELLFHGLEILDVALVVLVQLF